MVELISRFYDNKKISSLKHLHVNNELSE